jgi:hypothetical protein
LSPWQRCPQAAALIALAIFWLIRHASLGSGCGVFRMLREEQRGLQSRTTVSSRTVLSIDTSIVGR